MFAKKGYVSVVVIGVLLVAFARIFLPHVSSQYASCEVQGLNAQWLIFSVDGSTDRTVYAVAKSDLTSPAQPFLIARQAKSAGRSVILSGNDVAVVEPAVATDEDQQSSVSIYSLAPWQIKYREQFPLPELVSFQDGMLIIQTEQTTTFQGMPVFDVRTDETVQVDVTALDDLSSSPSKSDVVAFAQQKIGCGVVTIADQVAALQ